jgi:hypothetical protein|tara:strand:+ start:221 stop:454 length:234 start_codon:yes stop_codon:yes gene_type:complete
MLNEKKLLSIISKAVKEKVNLKSKSTNLENWDSLAQLQILSNLDKATKGQSSKLETLTGASSVQDILKILSKKKLLK